MSAGNASVLSEFYPEPIDIDSVDDDAIFWLSWEQLREVAKRHIEEPYPESTHEFAKMILKWKGTRRSDGVLDALVDIQRIRTTDSSPPPPLEPEGTHESPTGQGDNMAPVTPSAHSSIIVEDREMPSRPRTERIKRHITDDSKPIDSPQFSKGEEKEEEEKEKEKEKEKEDSPRASEESIKTTVDMMRLLHDDIRLLSTESDGLERAADALRTRAKDLYVQLRVERARSHRLVTYFKYWQRTMDTWPLEAIFPPDEGHIVVKRTLGTGDRAIGGSGDVLEELDGADLEEMSGDPAIALLREELRLEREKLVARATLEEEKEQENVPTTNEQPGEYAKTLQQHQGEDPVLNDDADSDRPVPDEGVNRKINQLPSAEIEEELAQISPPQGKLKKLQRTNTVYTDKQESVEGGGSHGQAWPKTRKALKRADAVVYRPVENLPNQQAYETDKIVTAMNEVVDDEIEIVAMAKRYPTTKRRSTRLKNADPSQNEPRSSTEIDKGNKGKRKADSLDESAVIDIFKKARSSTDPPADRPIRPDFPRLRQVGAGFYPTTALRSNMTYIPPKSGSSTPKDPYWDMMTPPPMPAPGAPRLYAMDPPPEYLARSRTGSVSEHHKGTSAGVKSSDDGFAAPIASSSRHPRTSSGPWFEKNPFPNVGERGSLASPTNSPPATPRLKSQEFVNTLGLHFSNSSSDGTEQQLAQVATTLIEDEIEIPNLRRYVLDKTRHLHDKSRDPRLS